MLKHLFMVAFAGALGAVSRYGVVNYIGGRYFPWGTMAVNVFGSAIMGVAFVIIMEKGLVSADMKPLVMTGFLGAFTTYSAFSLEAWQLLDRGELLSAFSYILGTTILCIFALFIGVLMARSTL
jgi:CrcB protein|tara:strand:- start:2675 stop:3046 length:372 start_codon:yes stop_codon:yes gene_type:complete